MNLIRDHLIRGRIIARYTLIDELLSAIILHAYFNIDKKKASLSNYKRQSRSKHFRAFVHHILDNLYPLQKMKLVHDLRPISPKARDIIDRVNALRNALAHSFHPENRYQYRAHKKVLYRDYNVFSLAGFTYVEMECTQVIDYLFERAYGIKSRSLTAIK